MSEISLSGTVLNSSNLADLSQKDKPWDKHRANADKVESYFAGSTFQNYADRVHDCSQLLDFVLASLPNCNAIQNQPSLAAAIGESLELKLSSARFCRVRSCPVCQWRRSLMWKAKAHQVLPRIVEKYPTHRWIFLTLTVRNCSITELRTTLTQMHKAFERMTKLKSFPAVGWIKATEVTRSQDNSAHPHFHCLVMVPSGYFSGQSYMKQADWVQLWRRSLRIDYDPVVDVRAIKKDNSPITLIPELLKYCTKESDLVADKEWFLELTRQMHKARTIAVGGVLKDYLKELEQEPEDLIGKDEETQVDNNTQHLIFEWKSKVKKYKLVD